ncbi:hypothetical protein LSH36_463g05067 [Paralvinella palmiformis]|uniref:COX assembly mitochondrial protein n=1 Tax=Paralvinella palmiformis TaxID=53620 RepID=A0AAD9J9W5_9ANNE|nr:hypothetical protein LSH36_463g05067 [Paralvinella palmiformis]
MRVMRKQFGGAALFDMHPDLSADIHTPECNELIELLKQCYTENPWGKFVGKCSTIDSKVAKCLARERAENSRKNREKRKEKSATS